MATASSDPVGPGRVVLIVGPSGAGKDTLIGIARAFLWPRADVLFPKRFVTRESSETEDNTVLTPAEYDAMLERGAFALHWRAHGVAYAIGTAVDDDVRRGATVVLNVSRTVVAEARARYARVGVAYIDAPAEVRAARIAARGRETAGASRLAQTSDAFAATGADLVIMNTGDAVEAGKRLHAFFVEG